MYQAKDGGRNRFVLYDQDAQSLRRTHNRVQWANRCATCWTRTASCSTASRWCASPTCASCTARSWSRIRDDNGNIVLPSQFIEYAESLGMVQEIDMRVVERLIEYLRQPENQGQKMRYFVNLSRVSISDQHWVRKFHNMLAASGIAQHNQLVFEITETAAMSDVDVTQQFIRELKQMGCRFALDDFGAGFSSFYYLKRFDVDYLKIDGGFIRDLATDEAATASSSKRCAMWRVV